MSGAPIDAGPIVTDRLRLVPWSTADAPALRRALDESDDHLRPYIPFMRHEPRDLDGTRQQLVRFAADFASGAVQRYAVWLRSSETLAGEVMLIARPDGLEVGYWLHVAQCGRGYATESVGALVDYAFDTLGATLLIVRCDTRNAPSNRIPLRLGGRVAGSETVRDGDGGHASLTIWHLRRQDRTHR